MIKHCKEKSCCKGKSCGKTCIKKSYNCRKGVAVDITDLVFPNVPTFKPCKGGLEESNAIDEFNRTVWERYVNLM